MDDANKKHTLNVTSLTGQLEAMSATKSKLDSALAEEMQKSNWPFWALGMTSARAGKAANTMVAGFTIVFAY